jgi:hypothetical protein
VAKSTRAELDRPNERLTLQHHETDCPLLPVPQLEQLQKFRPDAVDLVITETAKWGEHRRSEDRRVNLFVFVERIVGQICAFCMGTTAIAGGVYAAVNGQPGVGTAIVTIGLGTLAVAFLVKKKDQPPS